MYTNEAYLVIGRFQGYTSKHDHLVHLAQEHVDIRTMRAYFRAPEVLVGIVCGGMSSENTMLNPFSFQNRVWMIRQVRPSMKCLKLASGYLGDAIEICDGLGYELTRLYVGGDRAETYQKQIERYKYKIEVIVLERHEPVSGTDVREALKNEDKERFCRLSPSELHRHYEKIRTMYSTGRGWHGT